MPHIVKDRTQAVGGQEIRQDSITRDRINITISGHAAVQRILAGSGIIIEYTGIDEGTGEVTVSSTAEGSGVTVLEVHVFS